METSDEAWASRNGDGVHVLKLESGLLECLFEANIDILAVKSGSDLWHDSTVFGVNRHLGGDYVAKKLAVFGDGDCGLVAA